MSIPKLYTALSFSEDDTSSIDVLTDHSSEITTGTDGEKYAVLSYFPSTQKYSALSNYVLNKYVLFVSGESESKEYDVEWYYDLLDSDGISVLDRFVRDEIAGPSNFEFSLGLKDLDVPSTQNWELTLIINCHISKNGEEEKMLELQQTLLPIEAEMLSENLNISEDASNGTSVALGHEATTHFVRGHLSEYLIDKKIILNPSDSESPNNAAVFVNQTAAIIYRNILSAGDTLKPMWSSAGIETSIDSRFDQIFVQQDIERSIINNTPFVRNALRGIGICSLNLHHVLPFVKETEAERIENEEDIRDWLEPIFLYDIDNYVLAYLRSTFPKSAIGLSVDIFNHLFTSFQINAYASFHIYETFKASLTEQNAQIETWKQLNHSELRDSGSDNFMKNLIAEYYFGYLLEVTPYSRSESQPEQILGIDWSMFIQKILTPPPSSFSLNDFLSSNRQLDRKVERIFLSLSAHERVAQMLMPAAESAWKRNDAGKPVRNYDRDGRSIAKIKTLLREKKIGGILLLGGSKRQFLEWSEDFLELNSNLGNLPLLISADAEPSLINGKINGVPAVRRADHTESLSQVEEAANDIFEIIQEFGINYNFAPAIDVGDNVATDGRGYGSEVPSNNIPFSKRFISIMQENNVIATAKHFPGHGQVEGDSHHMMPFIDGALTELSNYPPLIDAGVLSIMIGHIEVQNNTEYSTGGLPASVSKTIITDLLRNELGFKGLIVTDALNMEGVADVEDVYVTTVEAGCDVLEMAKDSSQAHADILAKYNIDTDFKEKVDTACKRIIRMKVCLGLI